MSGKDTRKAPSQRQLRVGETIRHVLAEMFTEGEHYEALGNNTSITVTEVRISPDLRVATIYVLPLGGAKNEKEFLTSLKNLAPKLRRLLAGRVQLRFVPELVFRIDNTFAEVNRIQQLLHSIEHESPIDE